MLEQLLRGAFNPEHYIPYPTHEAVGRKHDHWYDSPQIE